jgi:ribosomal protein L5
MTSKVTLSIDSKVIEAAKKYSEKKGVSLSKIIEDYLSKITSSKTKKTNSSIKELSGILGEVPADFDYKEAITEYLIEKHLKR